MSELKGKVYEVVQDGAWFWAVVDGKKVGRSMDRQTALDVAKEVSQKGYTERENS